MEGMPNRSARRQMAKKAGFMKIKQTASFTARLEMIRRSAEFGKQIHLANTEKILRQQDEKESAEETNAIQKLIAEGMTYEEAKKKIYPDN